MTQSFELSTLINALVPVVWDSLVCTGKMKVWMGEPEMEIGVETDWTVGRPMVVSGFHHSHFRNIGTVLEFKPMERLSYTHLSSLSRLPDDPVNLTTLTFSLAPQGDATSLTLTAEGFPTVSIFKHLQFYWTGTLGVFKQFVERSYCRDAERLAVPGVGSDNCPA
jgi:uncharacterized protein YndB with AHSA1/START domain